MKKILSIYSLLMIVIFLQGANVTITMNSVSPIMALAKKTTGTPVEIGTPINRIYTFTAEPGKYILTASASDSNTVNGTIELEIQDGDNSFSILTHTVYATNSDWQMGADYTLHISVVSREGRQQVITVGQSTTSGRATFLSLTGNTYFCDFVPSENKKAEGFTTLYNTATAINNATISGTIPMASVIEISVPDNATVFVGRKTTHFVTFIEEFPYEIRANGQNKTYYYKLAQVGQYNYRVSRQGGLTQAGIFSVSQNEQDNPKLTFADADFETKSPQWINHDLTSNGGYNVADILLNINAQEHLKLALNDTFDLLPLRNWEIINTTTANYFIEPDYHYTITDVNGITNNTIVTIDSAGTLHAIGNGTAIVTVTYDAIHVCQYNKTVREAMAGGEYWSALWPENTGVFVVTVGASASGIETNMTINPTNNTQYKLSGVNYDADFDVLYFIDSIGYYDYTFKPNNVNKVEIAYPTIGDIKASYNGFHSEGVSYNSETGEYTVRIKEGRQIIKMSNSVGAEYQVIVGKPVHVELSVKGREHDGTFQPGDNITIQFSGLFHPANKLAGVHNFSATATYQNTTGGTSVSGIANKYTFCSTPASQSFTINLPINFDVNAVNKKYDLRDGVIKVNGFGDPIGNHRNTSKKWGRGANFTAVSQQAIFGSMPAISLPLRERIESKLRITTTPNDAEIFLSDYKKTVIEKNEDGRYDVTTENYLCTIEKTEYHTHKQLIKMPANGDSLHVTITLTKIDSADTGWDGLTWTDIPEYSEENHCYLIRSGYNLAWLSHQVGNGNYTIHAKLMNDISLSDFPWLPIGGNTSTTAYQGFFDGNGYTIRGLNIDTTITYQGLFGYIKNDTISNLSVEGYVKSAKDYVAGIVAYGNDAVIKNCISRVEVTGNQYVAGVVGYCNNNCKIELCGNEKKISSSKMYTGGITSYSNGTDTIINCYNTGDICGGKNYVGGIVGYIKKNDAVLDNVYNIGKIFAGNNEYYGAIRGNNDTIGIISHTYASVAYKTDTSDMENYVKTVLIDSTAFVSGEACYRIGLPFVQTIGKNAFPTFRGDTVYQHSVAGILYYSNAKDFVPNKMATFENETDGIQLTELDTFWFGKQPLVSGANVWSSGDYSFYTYNDDQYYPISYYYAFVVSNDTTRTSTGHEEPYRSVAGGAYEGNNFAIWSSDFYGSNGISLAHPDTVPGFFVNNNAYTLYAMENGYMSAKKFTEEDYLHLLCIGILGDSIIDTMRVILAENGKYINQWTYIDLSTLGVVDTIKFDMVGSDNNEYGLNTPAYFCLDNFGQKKPTDYTIPNMAEFKQNISKIGVIAEIAQDRKTQKVLINGSLYIMNKNGRYSINGKPFSTIH